MKSNPHGLLLKDDHFESSKSIRLGMDPKTVEEKLGCKLDKKQSKSGVLILSFRKEVLNDPFFKKYNMPVYYAKYVFRSNRLIEFGFGFEAL